MGSLIAEKAAKSENFELCACIDAVGGRELCGVRVQPASALESALCDARPDVVIDFSGADATAANAPVILRHADMVVGTTGLTPGQASALEAAVNASGHGAVISPNMALGVNVLFSIVESVSRALPGFDVEIVEAHHATKKDSPSGTAKQLAKKVGRSVPIHAIRAGGIVGDHTVIFASGTERLELTHRAQSREAFADGAIAAAEFVHSKTGVFSMADVIAAGRTAFREKAVLK